MHAPTCIKRVRKKGGLKTKHPVNRHRVFEEFPSGQQGPKDKSGLFAFLLIIGQNVDAQATEGQGHQNTSNEQDHGNDHVPFIHNFHISLPC
ncbi:hypothetical protein CARN8_6100006 [mine drainage metagenome]|uniref:Uncharacterized protein n=1 Tax=mine drainage metagenome TaxID=410659 RepID=A0A3P3ZRJ7_9ZZZZ